MAHKITIILTSYCLVLTILTQSVAFAKSPFRSQTVQFEKIEEMINLYYTNQTEYLRQATSLIQNEYHTPEDIKYFNKVVKQANLITLELQFKTVGNSVVIAFDNNWFSISELDSTKKSFVIGNTRLFLLTGESLQSVHKKVSDAIVNSLQTFGSFDLLIPNAHALDIAATLLAGVIGLLIALPFISKFFSTKALKPGNCLPFLQHQSS